MNLRRFSVVCMLVLFTLAFSACGGDVTERIMGAWKSEVADTASGKPTVVIFSSENVIIGGQVNKVTYKTMSLNVEASNAETKEVLFVVSKIDKDSLVLSGGRFDGQGQVKFRRITEAEVKEMLGE